MVLFTGFTGGFVTPLLVNQLPLPLENDVIIPLVILAWYTTSYCGTYHFWTHNRFAQVVLLVCIALFRTHTVMKTTIDAAEVFVPRAIYPSCALIGPIFVGTLSGCAALFFPQRSDGFQSVETETPWALQASFITSLLTHLMLHDKTGFFGTTLRAFIGQWDHDTISIVIASMHLVTIFLQTFVNAEANIFENLQVHSVAYFLTGVQKPLRPVAKNKEYSWAMTSSIENAIHWWKVVICILGPVYIFSVHVLPSQLHAGMDLLPIRQGQGQGLGHGQGIGHCTWLSEWRQCTPFRLTLHYKIPASGLESSSSNVKQNGEYALLVHDHVGQIVWSQKGQIPASYPLLEAGVSGLTDRDELRASLDKTGVLRVIFSDSASSSSSGGEGGSGGDGSGRSGSKQEQLLWASTSVCKKPSKSSDTDKGAGIATYMPRLVLNSVTGKPTVICDREELDTFSVE